jgi:phospholipase C
MRLPISLGLVSALALMIGGAVAVADDHDRDHDRDDVKTVSPDKIKTATKIKHLVVIFNENRSFDHYFGTYPNALNPPGEPAFVAAKGTPIPDNFTSHSELLHQNPNLNPVNGAGATNPFRLDRSQSNTASQSHNYTNEQLAFDNGKADLFPLDVGVAKTSGLTNLNAPIPLGSPAFNTTGQTMGYFDGNTVTAFWNYAQNFAMSDNAWSDTFGPSTPGLLNMFAGQTNGIVPQVNQATGGPLLPTLVNGVAQTTAPTTTVIPDGTGGFVDTFTLIADSDPTMDVCSIATQPGKSGTTIMSDAPNIGTLLNKANIPWGSFVGGFNLQTVNENQSTGCNGVTMAPNGQISFSANPGRSTISQVSQVQVNDYIPHHIWFQYFKDTANPNHVRPASTAEIGHDGPANHAYDIQDFQTAVSAGNYPAVSFIKLPAFQDSHPGGGESNTLDEQAGVVDLINFLQEQPDWDSTAVIIAYDDSDGWYDHAFAQPTSRASFSQVPVIKGGLQTSLTDALNGNGNCGIPNAPGTSLPTGIHGQGVNGRCGPGMRQPFLLISPYAKKNFISHVFSTQASIPQFIEDNWLNGERLGQGSFDNDRQTGSIMDMFDFSQKPGRKLILDRTEGTVVEASK